MKDLSGMAIAELDKYLAKLRADLEEVEEERLFVLRQTGLHVSAGTVKKYESELNDLKTKIDEAEQVLHTRQAE